MVLSSFSLTGQKLGLSPWLLAVAVPPELVTMQGGGGSGQSELMIWHKSTLFVPVDSDLTMDVVMPESDSFPAS